MVKILEFKEIDAGNLDDINALLRQLVHDPSTYVPVSERDFSAIVENSQSIIVAAKDEERIVGVGILFVIKKFRGIYGYIEDMIVDESYRGQGIGGKILDHLVKAARVAGVKTIELSTRPSRVPANNLYIKAGFEPKETNVYRMKL